MDPFFEQLRDGEWNACVGAQGDELNYVEGYLQAAHLLVDTLIGQELYGSRDTLAMPILYNVRHGLELALKFTLRELVRFGWATSRVGPANHDILAYWTHLSEPAIADEACRTCIADLRPFVESLARIDDDGQELRYFENRNGEQSLGGQAVVNLPLIRDSVTALRTIIDRLTDRLYGLGQEHVTGTRTQHCSRADLAEIARMIGARST